MSKSAEQVKPNYGPVYAAAMYPELARMFVDSGYALAVHGSLARDFDLIAVPWAETLASPVEVIKQVEATFAVKAIRTSDGEIQWTFKNHGRRACTISIGYGECAVDLSFLDLPVLSAERRLKELHTALSDAVQVFLDCDRSGTVVCTGERREMWEKVLEDNRQ